MYRITVVCHGLQASNGEQAARAITEDFDGTARCEWNGSEFILRADTDTDDDTISIADHFRKCIEAEVAGELVGADLYVQSVEEIP